MFVDKNKTKIKNLKNKVGKPAEHPPSPHHFKHAFMLILSQCAWLNSSCIGHTSVFICVALGELLMIFNHSVLETHLRHT